MNTMVRTGIAATDVKSWNSLDRQTDRKTDVDRHKCLYYSLGLFFERSWDQQHPNMHTYHLDLSF